MLNTLTPARSLLILGLLSCVLLFSLSPHYNLLDGQSARTHLHRRQGVTIPGLPSHPATSSDPPSSSPTSAAVTSVEPTSTPPPAETTSQPSSAPPSSEPTSTPTSTPPQTSQDSTSSPPSTPTSTPPATTPSTTPPPSPTTTLPVSTVASLTTNENGQTETVFQTVTPSATEATPSASQSSSSDQTATKSKGVGTSTIVGLSVAGGIALIGIIAFVIWKFTRKRFSDDFDDNEAIKWPELNAHGENPHALPTNRTGGAGFETNSEVNLTRPDSRAGSFATSGAASAVDLYAPTQDPYAVPPLPHLNPNQPYRDDPSSGFYDPYSGPVPQTFQDSASQEGGGEAIPMTQIGSRARSPGPQMIFDPAARTMSPGPAAAYDMAAGRMSPGPQASFAYAEGRNSPGPRARSPGPAAALGGRVSPGPQVAYGYGGAAGRQSPGPGIAYGS